MEDESEQTDLTLSPPSGSWCHLTSPYRAGASVFHLLSTDMPVPPRKQISFFFIYFFYIMEKACRTWSGHCLIWEKCLTDTISVFLTWFSLKFSNWKWMNLGLDIHWHHTFDACYSVVFTYMYIWIYGTISPKVKSGNHYNCWIIAFGADYSYRAEHLSEQTSTNMKKQQL